MTFTLRADALSSAPEGFTLRVALPWMRSLPLSCVLEMGVHLDGEAVAPETLEVVLGQRCVPLGELGDMGEIWWFLQDRLVLRGASSVGTGERHDVTVSMRLMLPYLNAGDGPAILPFSVTERLVVDAPATAKGVSHDVT